MEFQDQFILISNTPLGDLQVRYYGIIIVFAMLVAAWVGGRIAQRRGYDPDHIWGGLTWAIFPGIIGARLWFILFPPASLTAGCIDPTLGVCQDTAWFLENFFNPQNGAIAVWSGGLGIYGAVLGGALGAWLYSSRLHNAVAFFFYIVFYPLIFVYDAIVWAFDWLFARIRRKPARPYAIPRFVATFPPQGFPLLPWVDIVAVILPLAQFIGRWANYVNQELYGLPTGVSWWGIPIDTANRIPPYTSLIEYPVGTLFHPLFLYEGLWSLAAFFLLLNLYRNRRNSLKVGDFFLLYLGQYGFIRFVLEFLRAEPAYFSGTSIGSNQVISLGIFVVAMLWFFLRRSSAPTQSYDAATPASIVSPPLPKPTASHAPEAVPAAS